MLADYPSGLAPTFQARAASNILAGSQIISAEQAEASGVLVFDELLLRAAAGDYIVNVTVPSQQVDHHHCVNILVYLSHIGTNHASHPVFSSLNFVTIIVVRNVTAVLVIVYSYNWGLCMMRCCLSCCMESQLLNCLSCCIESQLLNCLPEIMLVLSSKASLCML